MAVGQTYAINPGTSVQYFVPSGFIAPTIGVLNPNDGIAYVARNRQASNTSVGSWDYKVPSQSYAVLPGMQWQSVGVFYLDQSGANTKGEITVYPLENKTTIPIFQAIGRAAQSAGTTVDISTGNQPQNPPANTGRLWIDNSGNLNLLDANGNNRTELDSVNAPTYVQPIINATALGGDLNGTIPNGRVWAHTGPIGLDFNIPIRWNDTNHQIWVNANVMYFNEYGSFVWQHQGTQTMSLDGSGNLNPASSIYLGNNQWVFFGSGNTNGIISDNTNLYLRTNGSAYFQNTSGAQQQILTGNIDLDTQNQNDGGGPAANASNRAGLQFGAGNSGEGITSPRTTGSNNQYGLDFWTGGTCRFQIANNGTVQFPAQGFGFAWYGAPNTQQLMCWTNNNFYWDSCGGWNWRNSASGLASCMTLDLSGNMDLFGSLRLHNASAQSQASIVNDGTNIVYKGNTGGGNHVFQHADGSWMGTMAANFQVQSDIRAKNEISTVPDEDCIRRIRVPGIPIITWSSLSPMPSSPSGLDIGFAAQDMESAVPEAVAIDASGSYFLAYGNLTAVLWGALRALDAQVQSIIAALPPGMRPPNIYVAP